MHTELQMMKDMKVYKVTKLLEGLKEEIYMHQPKGFEDGNWHLFIWLMLRTIYGLKQLALEWYKQVRAIMTDLGFIQANSDHALFYYEETNIMANKVHTHCFLAWHINNGMGVCNSRPFLKNIKKWIMEHFGIKDLGVVAKYLGIQFKHD